MKRSDFRIYGREGTKIWKLAWASQGKDKDIQYSAHTLNGISYNSIHQSGEIHTTMRYGDKTEHFLKRIKPYTLNNFKFLDFIDCMGIAKKTLKSIPICRVQQSLS